MYKKVASLALAFIMLMSTIGAGFVIAEGVDFNDLPTITIPEEPMPLTPDPNFQGETVWADPEEEELIALFNEPIDTTPPIPRHTLLPGEYYMGEININDLQYAFGAIWQEATSPSAIGMRTIDPSVISASVHYITDTTALLRGHVNNHHAWALTHKGFWFRPDHTTVQEVVWATVFTNIYSVTITGLTPDTQYHARAVIRHNAYHGEVQSNAISFFTEPAQTITTPSAPLRLSGTPFVDEIDLSWDPPANNGGSPITHYQVTMDNWLSYANVTGTTFTARWLTPGTYTFRVRAVNAAGAGAAATIDVTLRDIVPPTVVGDSTTSPAIDTDTEIILLGQVLNNGGAAITHWGFWIREENAPPNQFREYVIRVQDGSFDQIISGLTPGTTYVARAVARNAALTNFGESGVIRFTTTAGASNRPSAPRNFRAEPGDESLELHWEEPLDDGGSPIVRYERSVNGGAWQTVEMPGGRMLPGDEGIAATSLLFGVIIGLPNNVPVTIRLRAVNADNVPGDVATTTATPLLAPPILEVDTTPRNVPAAGGTLTVRVESNVGWTVSVSGIGNTPPPSGFTVTPSGGIGNGTITINVGETNASNIRTAIITIRAGLIERSIAVNQMAGTLINLDGNGGTVSSATVVVSGNTIGNALDSISATRPGFALEDFAGWFTAPTGGVRVTPTRQISDGDTFYARWYVEITLNPNGGTAGRQVIRLRAGEPIMALPPLDANPDRRGYLFEGWFRTGVGGVSEVGFFDLAPNHNETFFALWSLIWHSVPYPERVQWFFPAPHVVHFWPDEINIHTRTLGEVSNGFMFHIRVDDARLAWQETLGVDIGIARTQEGAQILAIGGPREEIEQELGVRNTTWAGVAQAATTTRVGAVTVDGVNRGVYSLSGQARMFVIDYYWEHASWNWNMWQMDMTQKTTSHELGHVLGYWGHSPDVPTNAQDVMLYGAHSNYTLQPTEQRHLRQIYDRFR